MIGISLLALFVLTGNAVCVSVSENIGSGTVPKKSPGVAPAKQFSGEEDDLETTLAGSWEPISDEDLAGGFVRVSDDGPKIETPADPRVDVAWDLLITREMISAHPNHKYFPPLSECGYPAVLNNKEILADVEVGPEEGDENLEVYSDEDDDYSGDEGAAAIRKKRIVGGKVVPPQRHPWMVQLYLYNVSSSLHTFHCAGTLISNATILTASHCLTRLTPGTTLDVVVVGNTDRRKLVFCLTTDPEERCSRENIKEIEDMEVHYAYNEGNLNHDIALIYLREPVIYSDDVRPICLPFSSRLFESWPDLKLTGIGWGSTSKYGNRGVFLSEVLKQVEFDLQPRHLCDKFHMRIYGRVREDRICTGGNTGRASCNGDSGGAVVKALAVPDMEDVERVFQIGIVSAGGHPVDTCGFQGRPAIDTSVFYFMDWIMNHIVPGAASYRFVKNEDLSAVWIVDDSEDPEEPEVRNAFIGEGHHQMFVNELSTGRNIDVSSHPNVGLLPSFKECGNLPTPATSGTMEIPLSPESEYFGPPIEPVFDTDPIDAGLKSVRRAKRIVGGVPVDLENFYPWMAQIYVRDVETNELGFRCSGSVISNRHILTAAHCVTEIMAPYVFDSILLGQYNRNSSEECIDDICYPPVKVEIAEVMVNSEYEKYTHKSNIALILLANDITFTRMIQPICLPRRESLIDGIQLHRYFTVGWGRILRESGGPGERGDRMSEILLKMYVDLFPRRDCDFVYSRTIDLLDRSRVCGGGQASQGECLGDGGGPLMKKLLMDDDHPLNNKVFQMGIVSFADCGMQGMPTVYMNIIYYMNWILDNLIGTGDEQK